MCVLRTVEKDERVLALRMSFGRAFQREGAAAAKALMERHRKHKHRVLIGRKCVCVCAQVWFWRMGAVTPSSDP